jgi:hypothetical protein
MKVWILVIVAILACAVLFMLLLELGGLPALLLGYLVYALGAGTGAYAASRERTPEGRKGERA